MNTSLDIPLRRIGFAGLGVIGIEMAQRILQAGFELHVWNRSADKAAPLVALGARLAATPAELSGSVDALCLCVTDARAVEQIMFEEMGIATANADALQRLIVVDHSTLHPDATRRIAARFETLGGAWVDAPVSGGPSGARDGALSVFVGGDVLHVERVRPVLMSFARRVTHLGATGSGQAAKACNQMVSFGTAAVLAEALNLAAKLGLDVARLPGAMEGGLADSAVLHRYAKAMITGELTGSALTALKDLEVIVDLGRETGSPMPMTGLLASLHRLLASQGHFKGGMAGVIRLYSDGPLAGAVVTPQEEDQ